MLRICKHVVYVIVTTNLDESPRLGIFGDQKDARGNRNQFNFENERSLSGNSPHVKQRPKCDQYLKAIFARKVIAREAFFARDI